VIKKRKLRGEKAMSNWRSFSPYFDVCFLHCLTIYVQV